ncbi:MAG: DUF6868 family protein [Pseudomonadota bacterium]
MNDLQTLTTFLGWCTVLNVAFYVFTVLALFTMRDLSTRIGTRIFKVSEADYAKMTLEYVARFKLAVIVLNFAPYIALRIMA